MNNDLSTDRVTLNGKNYLLKDELNIRGNRCIGCAFDSASYPSCKEVPCVDSIAIEDTPEAITKYLDLKLNGEDEGELNE
jgi:hypothetical protein